MRFTEERGETVAAQFTKWLARFNYISLKKNGTIEWSQYPSIRVWGALDYLKRHGFSIVKAMALVMVLATPALAGPMVDFSNGPLGDLGTYNWDNGSQRVDSVGGTLYRWNTNEFHHFDAGLGIFGPNERINPAEPEINPGEFMRILSNVPMVGMWFTSVNNKANLDIYLDWFPAGPKMNVNGQSCHQRDRGQPQYSCYISFDPTPVAWVTAAGPKNDNFSLVWGVDTLTEVPEPGSMSLLGLGLLFVARRVRR